MANPFQDILPTGVGAINGLLCLKNQAGMNFDEDDEDDEGLAYTPSLAHQ